MTNEELEVLNQKRKDLEALKQFLKTSSPKQKAEAFENVRQKILNSEEQPELTESDLKDLLVQNLTDKELGE